MSARKLGRFAGLVFVLAVVFGGAGAASIDHAHTASAASTSVAASTAVAVPNAANGTIDWD
jgi:hypothetical protein